MRGTAQRSFNAIAGTLLWLGGLGMLGSGIYVSMTPAIPKPRAVLNEVEIDPQSCAEVLTSLGMRVNRDQAAGTLTANGWPGDVSALDNMTRISLGMSACKMPALSFCYKKGCPANPSGFQLVLTTKGEAGVAEAKAKAVQKGKPAVAKQAAPGNPGAK